MHPKTAMREAAVLLLTRNHQVLLGLHYGGRNGRIIIPPSETLEPGETPFDAACRGIREEVKGIRVPELHRVGLIQIVREGDHQHDILLHIFRGRITEGQPKIFPEGEFEWLRFYPIDRVPLRRSWEDAPYWFPQVMNAETNDPIICLRVLIPRPQFVVSRICPPPNLELLDAAG